MKSLSVLCIVLWFRSGDFFELQNNILRSRYQNQGSIQFDPQRNIGSPVFLNNGYNNFRESQAKARFVGRLNSEEPQPNLRFEQPHIYPEYINSQQFNRINEQPLNQQENSMLESQYFQNPQELLSEYIKPQELRSVYANLRGRRFNDAQLARSEVNSGAKLQLPSSLSYVPQQQYKEPAQRILSINQEVKSDLMYPSSINTQSIRNGNIAPIISNADTEFELQGISPELIQSMINQNNMKSKTLDFVQPHVSLPKSYENIESVDSIDIENRKPFYSSEYHFDQNRARFESPSAEVLYNMKKALPYTIRSQQLPIISQDDINFKNIIDSIGRIEHIIKSTPPVKRYMIIRPDGRVEHVDDIEKNTKIHPNYVMIKSQDALKYVNSKTAIPGLQVPQPKVALPLDNDQLISTVNQNQYATVEQQINKILLSQNLNTQISAKESEAEELILPSKANMIASTIPLAVDIASKKAINLSKNNSQQKINNPLSKEIRQNITSVLPSVAQTSTRLKSELSITHSLPIIKAQEIPNIKRASENSTDIFSTQNQQPISLDVVLTAESNKNGTDGISTAPFRHTTASTTIEKSDEMKNQTKVENANFIISENATAQLQHEVEICTSEESIEESREYDSNSSPASDIIQVSGDNFNNIEPLNQPDNNIEFSITEINNLPVLYINHETSQYINNNEPTNNVTVGTAPLISSYNETEVPIDEQLNTNTSSTRRGISSESENITSSVNTSNSGGFWFQSDDLFWENITNSNDSEKFYFLFIPPKPSVIEKETKTTIYANGTTVEEIIVTRDLDGVPTVVRNVKVSHANGTVIDV